jgi:hypothetical protein
MDRVMARSVTAAAPTTFSVGVSAVVETRSTGTWVLPDTRTEGTLTIAEPSLVVSAPVSWPSLVPMTSLLEFLFFDVQHTADQATNLVAESVGLDPRHSGALRDAAGLIHDSYRTFAVQSLLLMARRRGQGLSADNVLAEMEQFLVLNLDRPRDPLFPPPP